MNSYDLRQGCSYLFNVIKESSNNKTYKVKTDDGIEFSLLKFKFQHNQPIPDKIKCYVKSLLPLALSQDVAEPIRNFYKEGNDYDFIVKSIKKDPDLQYELEDEHGLCFKLYSSPIILSKGSRIKCRITKIKDAYVNLKYIGILSNLLPLEFRDISQWVNLLSLRKPSYYYKTLLRCIPAFAPAHEKYLAKEPGWIIDTLELCAENVPDWLIDCKNNLKALKTICDRLESARRVTLYILEESDFLRPCSTEQRSILQKKLSNFVELFEQYRLAASKILEGTHEVFIDSMFARLKEAGYLYKPSRQIRIMMTILRLRPELINERMGELFETLHNWKMSNWQNEPFRSALTQHLQIFIEENSESVNLLPVSDSGRDNKKLSMMILSIAMQRLFAIDSDNIDLNLNRSMLYRYISYLYPAEVNVLLEKSMDSLLGVEIPNEFTWEDTDNPTLLFVKSTYPAPPSDDRDIIVKSYISSKGEIRLQNNKLHIIAAGADPESTVIPNNMFDWLEPKISLPDYLDVNIGSKSKDLKIYKTFWDEISRSIINNDYNIIPVQEKIRPEYGDTVNIIIDGYRLFDDVHEKQRLQFHCKITDDNYVGSGWIPCDTFHMVGWFSFRDINPNSRELIDFAYDEDGNPLIYKATVQKFRELELEFSMKNQIEEFLFENFYPGIETTAIITNLDRRSNDWICLSESGASFKIPYDDVSSDYKEGSIVRIKYLETDSASNNSQFFIGELSEDQSNLPTLLKKSDCLYNLMQSLGVAEEEKIAYEVKETEQVMTKEEMSEIIWILQRRAVSETEYLKAFNYLGLASVLSKFIEDEHQLTEIEIHMGLLQVLHDFGRNKKIDFDTLKVYDDKVRKYPLLERLYTRLRIVSDIESNENSEWLWEIRKNPRNEIEGTLAALVLSYNMLPSDMTPMKIQIKDQISVLLNINNTVPQSKYYGEESQTVEFKSSLIYSSKNGSHPSPEEQLFEITHIICGFMNAKGGILYIGVNDSGYESGLEDDLAYRKLHKEKATIDGMIVDLQNHLDRTLPYHAKDKWEISSVADSKKGVIKVEVKPVLQPVELNGVIYVRSSSSTKPRLNAEREEFIKNRPHNYQIIMALLGIDYNTLNEDINQETPEELKIAESQSNEKSINSEIENQENKVKIKKSRFRKDILHEHEDNYIRPDYYLYFYNDNAVAVSHNDLWHDMDEDCRLALSIKEKESDSYIILTIDAKSIVKIPLEEFEKLPEKERHSIKSRHFITHVSIGKEDDFILSVFRNASGQFLYRIDEIRNFPVSSLNEISQNRFSENNYIVEEQEIISKDQINFFKKDALNLSSRFEGVQVPIGDGTLTEEERIQQLIKPLEHN